MKAALLQTGVHWLLGLVDDEHARLILAPLDDGDDTPAPVVTLRYPAMVQFGAHAVPGRLEGQMAMVGQALPIWMQVTALRVDLESVAVGEVYDLPSKDEPDETGTALLRAYLGTLAGVGITMNDAGATRVRLGRV